MDFKNLKACTLIFSRCQILGAEVWQHPGKSGSRKAGGHQPYDTLALWGPCRDYASLYTRAADERNAALQIVHVHSK